MAVRRDGKDMKIERVNVAGQGQYGPGDRHDGKSETKHIDDDFEDDTLCILISLMFHDRKKYYNFTHRLVSCCQSPNSMEQRQKYHVWNINGWT
jgi:hypothetical protein